MMLTPKARKVLDMLDDVLAHESSETAHGVWDVLTALRGPDSADRTAKSATTVHIRRLAFPKTAERHLHDPRLAQFATDVDFRVPREEQEHFRWHVQWAADVLGLDGYDG